MAELIPSVQIAEVNIAQFTSRFIDVAPFPPEIHFSKEKRGKRLGVSLTPGLFKTIVGPQDEPVLPDYFYGTYQIYRTSIKPVIPEHMEDKLVGTIDKSTRIANNNRAIAETSQNILSAFFYDHIQDNKKYYYAFKSLTFHGTPSAMSPIYEVELIRDSDEYKVEVNHFQFEEEMTHSMSKSFKRLLKIEPNTDRLFFSFERSIDDYEIGDGSPKLVGQPGSTSRFKIRIKSKHTGKMIDLNINFTLDSNIGLGGLTTNI